MQASDPLDPRAVLGAVKAQPGNAGASRKPSATAGLDRPCARRDQRSAGRDEGTALVRRAAENGDEIPPPHAVPQGNLPRAIAKRSTLRLASEEQWYHPPETRCLSWVKLRRTQCEQMSSELPLKADVAQCSRHVSKVPMHKVAALQPAARGARVARPGAG